MVTSLVHPAAAGPLSARIELGHWLAECGPPASYCRYALRLEYGTDGFVCPSCGIARDVAWPEPDAARRIVALLAARPDWATRNWLPHESVDDLLAENLFHGVEHCTPIEGGGAASTLWLDQSGRLHVADEPLIIDAAPRLAIGGQ